MSAIKPGQVWFRKGSYDRVTVTGIVHRNGEKWVTYQNANDDVNYGLPTTKWHYCFCW